MGNGNGIGGNGNGTSGFPQWVNISIYLVNKVGLPTVLIILGIAIGAGWIDSPVVDAVELLKNHVQEARRDHSQTERMTKLLKLICESVASDVPVRRECSRI